MKNLFGIVFKLLVAAYAVVIVFSTACLLCYNQYKITEFGNFSLIIANDELEPNYHDDSLIVVKKNNDEDIKVGDEIFFYDTYNSEVNVSLSKVIDKRVITDTEVTYTIEGDHDLSTTYVIGKAETSSVIEGLGNVISIITSKWGFLFLIIFPTFFAFIYEIYAIAKEVKGEKTTG